jgi:hypothetical protein
MPLRRVSFGPSQSKPWRILLFIKRETVVSRPRSSRSLQKLPCPAQSNFARHPFCMVRGTRFNNKDLFSRDLLRPYWAARHSLPRRRWRAMAAPTDRPKLTLAPARRATFNRLFSHSKQGKEEKRSAVSPFGFVLCKSKPRPDRHTYTVRQHELANQTQRSVRHGTIDRDARLVQAW